MDSDEIENEIADPSDASLYGEPGTEFNLFLDQQSEIMAVLMTEIPEPYLHIFMCNGKRMAISFELTASGMKTWIRAFDGDALTKPEASDLDGVVIVEV